MSDRNLWAVATKENVVTYDNVLQFAGELPATPTIIPSIITFPPLDDKGTWSSALKVADGAQGNTLAFRMIDGGDENCVDLNNGAKDNWIHATMSGFVHTKTQQFITCKGGSHRNVFSGCILGDCSNPWDVCIGSYSSQSMMPSIGNTVMMVRRTGRKVRVVSGWALFTKIDKSTCEILFWWSLGHKIYVPSKWILEKVLLPVWRKIIRK